MSARVFPEALPDISTIVTALADRSVGGHAPHSWTVADRRGFAVRRAGATTASEHVDRPGRRGIAVDARQGRHCYIVLAE